LLSRAWIPALTLIALITLARLIYLLWLSPYDLAEDEAFYWDWSRHLAWSYHTKGPGIAWALWLATNILGDTVVAVRSVALIASAIACAAVAGLTIDVVRAFGPSSPIDREVPASRAALLAVALFQLAPVFQSIALLSTIDGPYIACWALSCWAGIRALLGSSRSAWLWLGAALGLGFLFKYTILLVLPGLILFAIVHRSRLRLAPNCKSHALIGTFIFALALLPVIIWNAQHDWTTIKHLIGHLGMEGGDSTTKPIKKPWSPMWPIELIVGQLGFAGPVLIIAFIAAWRTRAQRFGTIARDYAARMYLFWLAAPLLLFYLGVTFIARAEMNWPIACHVTLIIFASVYLSEQLALPHPRVLGLTLPRHALNTCLIVGLLTGLLMLRLDLVRSALNAVNPAWAKLVPVGRVIGGKQLAGEVDKLRAQLRQQTSATPMVMCAAYGRASQVAFYLPDHPSVYCTSSRMGGRIVQQDFWPDTNLDDPALLGRDAIIVGSGEPIEAWSPLFERVEPVGILPGEHRPGKVSFIARSFKGFPKPIR
jgi:4-amino-4-deoxy-L-arabinose transferase-like glycosyltransferase